MRVHCQSRLRFSTVSYHEIIDFLKWGFTSALDSVGSNPTVARGALIAQHELYLSDQNRCAGRNYATGDDFPSNDHIKKNNTIK